MAGESASIAEWKQEAGLDD